MSRRALLAGAAAVACLGAVSEPAASLPPPAGPGGADGTWVQLDPPAPGHRYGAQMAYDAALHRTVLFGGYTLGEPARDDTWTFDGRRWRRVRTAHVPPGRTAAAFAYSPALHRIVMFGGYDPHARASDTAATPCGWFGDTWTFDGRDWTPIGTGQDTSCHATAGAGQQAGPQPLARFGAGFGYDATSRSLLLVGGYGCTGFPGRLATCGYLADSWRFDSRWRAGGAAGPSPRGFAQVADDDGVPVVFGGVDAGLSPVLGDTWTWEHGRWLRRHPRHSPPARDGGAATPWPGHGAVVAAGHPECQDRCLALDDVWVWHRGDWHRLPGTLPGDGLYLPSLAADPTGRLLLAHGLTSAGPDAVDTVQLRDSWRYDGRRWQLLPYPWPDPATPLGAWWDPVARSVVVVDAPWAGAASGAGVRTWVRHGGLWHLDTAAGAPTPLRQTTSVGYDPVRREAVLYGGQNLATQATAIGWFADTWVLRSGRWRRILTAHQPPPGSAVMTYDPARRSIVMQLSPIESEAVDVDSPAPYNGWQLWRWTGSDWLPLATTRADQGAREFAAFGYVPAVHALVLDGGYRGLEPRPDQVALALPDGASVWEPGVGPLPERAQAAFGVAADGTGLLVGGCAEDLLALLAGNLAGAASAGEASDTLQSSGICYADTWALDAGGWHRLAVATAPPARAGAVLVRGDDGRLLLVGGRHGQDTTDDIYQWRPAH